MSKRKRNYERKPRKSKWKIALAIVAAVLADLLLFAGIMAAFTPKELNPDNLLKYEAYTNKLEETAGGLKISWDDDGSFTINGKHSSEDTQNDSRYLNPFASVELTAGKYEISTNNRFCSTDSYGMYYVLDGEIHYVTSQTVTFEVKADTTVEVGFFVENNDYILYADFEPVLVPEDKDTDFHAK